jgi:hypothetical protein
MAKAQIDTVTEAAREETARLLAQRLGRQVGDNG